MFQWNLWFTDFGSRILKSILIPRSWLHVQIILLYLYSHSYFSISQIPIVWFLLSKRHLYCSVLPQMSETHFFLIYPPAVWLQHSNKREEDCLLTKSSNYVGEAFSLHWHKYTDVLEANTAHSSLRTNFQNSRGCLGWHYLRQNQFGIFWSLNSGHILPPRLLICLS